MTRFAITWLIAVTVAALGLFHVSHRVEQLENELLLEQRSILQEQQNIDILKAEWSYLNRPERIADLAQRHLALVPLSADRMVSIDDLPQRQEPGAGSPVPGLSSEETIPQAISPTLTSTRTGQ
jgi:cell division protein FtsL